MRWSPLQRDCDAVIAGVNFALENIDAGISAAEDAGVDASALYDNAVEDVRGALSNVHAIRDTYLTTLHSVQSTMLATTGYNSEVLASVDAAPDDATAAADQYDQSQRAADQATVDQAKAQGVQTEASRAAAARLRDSDTVDSPAADPAARRLAGERLADYRDSKLTGPLPTDPVLGNDPRTRAKGRLKGQQLLESGFGGKAQPMTPDQATLTMNRMEAIMRQGALNKLDQKLIQNGVSTEGAKRMICEIEEGKSVDEVIHEAAEETGMSAKFVEVYGEKTAGYMHTGSRCIAERARPVAMGMEVYTTAADLISGTPPLEELAKFSGGLGGGMVGDLGATGIRHSAWWWRRR